MTSSPPRKLLGEQAECVFLAAAVRRGFIVSHPFGDCAPYDFIVQPRPLPTDDRRLTTRVPLQRIQVKSVFSKDPQGRYTVNLSRFAGVSDPERSRRGAGVRRRNPERSEGTPARLWRIQVKSVFSKDAQGRYTVNTRRSGSGAYCLGEFDFFACWIAPLDLWYLIPASRVIPHKCVHLYPDVEHSRGKYERFKDAWRLLR